jgi:Ser/Thr protein kinase RdoA (MazF antagonist)
VSRLSRTETSPFLDAVLSAWEIPQPRRVAPIGRGSNNLSWRVESAACACVLRIYQNTADPASIAGEHHLLLRLQEMDLSFAVPHPPPALSGGTLVPVAAAGSTAAWAAPFPVIPGDSPHATNASETFAAGAALAELDAALAKLPPDLMTCPPTSYGDLAHVHPLVPSPSATVDLLQLTGEDRRAWQDVLAAMQAAAPALYAALPQQLIHTCGNLIQLT